MVRAISQLFVAGPPVVEYATHEKLTKVRVAPTYQPRNFSLLPIQEELGGVDVCGSNGAIDNIAESEEDAFRIVRRFLSFLPSNVWELPPRVSSSDLPNRREEGLLSIVPKQRNQSFDIRRLIALVP